MIKIRLGQRRRSRFEGLYLLDSIAWISPGSRVAAMTGHAIPDVERELIARDRSNQFRNRLRADRILTALRDSAPSKQHLVAGRSMRDARRIRSTR